MGGGGVRVGGSLYWPPPRGGGGGGGPNHPPAPCRDHQTQLLGIAFNGNCNQPDLGSGGTGTQRCCTDSACLGTTAGARASRTWSLAALALRVLRRHYMPGTSAGARATPPASELRAAGGRPVWARVDAGVPMPVLCRLRNPFPSGFPLCLPPLRICMPMRPPLVPFLPPSGPEGPSWRWEGWNGLVKKCMRKEEKQKRKERVGHPPGGEE